MLQIPYEKLLSYIVEESDKSQDEIETLVAKKLDEFSGLISQEGALHVVAHDLGVSLTDQIQTPLSVKDIKPGQKGVKIECKILKKYAVSTFEREQGKGTVGSILIGDETGVMRITFWHEQTTKMEELTEDSTYTFENLTAKDNQGRTELTYTQSSSVSPLDKDITVSQQTQPVHVEKRTKIADATVQSRVRFFGTIVQVLKPTVFIIDAQTRKRVRIQDSEFDKEQHEYSIVGNILLDDGTEVIRCAVFSETCESLFGFIISEYLSNKDNEAYFEEKKTELLGLLVSVIGRVTKNDLYDRVECIVSSIEKNPDPSSV
ncbi:MAG: hypothetical protein ACMXYA_01335 [Candidatus Woesearchaeota archaeon]